MGEDKNIKKLLRHVYSNSNTLDEWLQHPQQKTKEWNCELEGELLEAVRSTVKYVSEEFQQIQEIRYVNQHTIKKINAASRHAVFSFYTTMTMQLIAFVIGIIVMCLGLYALFNDRTVLGLFLSTIGIAELTYFLITKPLQSLNENIGNMVKMEMALGSWFNEMTYWQIMVRDTNLEEKQIVAQAMRDSVKWAIMLVEDYTTTDRQNHVNTDTYNQLSNHIKSAISRFTKKKEEQKEQTVDKYLPKSKDIAPEKPQPEESSEPDKKEEPEKQSQEVEAESEKKADA